jgi:hypothetical protein
MKFVLYISLCIIFVSCGKIQPPSIISPSQNFNIHNVSYGQQPDNYQQILKEYLISKLQNYKTAKVEFINEPAKLSIDHLGDTYSGYRVCLSINEQKGDYYVGYRNHFFLINKGKVTLHLFDSGLLAIPFEYCVSRDATRQIFIDDIPDSNTNISIEKMDVVKVTKKRKDDGFTYISCLFEQDERTYVFNENKNIFKQIERLSETEYSVKFNEAFIIANIQDTELTINRVSGNASLVSNTTTKGACKLTNKTKF